MDVFRVTISRPIPPKTIALSTMQDVMKPQKQTNFHEDENQLLENGLRPLFLTQNSISLLTAQTPVRDKYQKKKRYLNVHNKYQRSLNGEGHIYKDTYTTNIKRFVSDGRYVKETDA